MADDMNRINIRLAAQRVGNLLHPIAIAGDQSNLNRLRKTPLSLLKLRVTLILMS
jgi:hypothetical protein